MTRTSSPTRYPITLTHSVVVGLTLMVAAGASAASFTVTQSNDLPDLNTADGVCATVTGGCSLRAAVMQANALSGDDFIYENTGKHIRLGSPLVIESDITIYGHGDDADSGTRIDGDDNDEVFTIRSGGYLEVQDARIYNGVDSNIRLPSGGTLVLRDCVVTGGSGITGGGIRGSSATITLDATEVSSNQSTSYGGGIALDGASSTLYVQNGSFIHGNTTAGNGGGIHLSAGEMYVEFSTIDHNTATGKGGGIYVGYGSLDVEFSMIQHNVASHGGGISAYQASGIDIRSCTVSDNEAAGHGGGIHFDYNTDRAYLTNVTISGNTADRHGGGIYLNSDLAAYWGIRLFSCTITRNIADADFDDDGDGGGIYRLDHWGECELRNTILAENYDASMAWGSDPSWAPDCAAELDSLGYNLVGVGSDTAHCSVTTQTGDRIGTPTAALDPMLGPLTNTVYYTEYHVPENGSPVVDNADPAGCVDAHYQPLLHDQRGEARVSSFAPDIGSVESVWHGQPVLTITNPGGGRVQSTPGGIDCGTDCTEAYSYNTVVSLTADPSYVYDFDGWTGDADCSDGVVTMSAHRTCSPVFSQATAYTLAVYTDGDGSGTVRWHLPDDITFECAPCGTTIRSGDTVTLEPLPNGGSVFAGWSGDPDCSDGVVTVTAQTTCTATFDLAGSGVIFESGFEGGSLSGWTIYP